MSRASGWVVDPGKASGAIIAGFLILGAGTGLSACSPTVKIEAPEKPIVINLNVRIEQDVRIRLEKDLEELFDTEEDIF